MKKVILVRYGEITLKGLNRPVFEQKLIQNMRQAISKFGKVKIIKSQSRIYVEPELEEYSFDEALDALTKVFGIVSVSPVLKVEPEYEVIKNIGVELSKKEVENKGISTFKVETRRGNKHFPMKSPEVSRELGGDILDNVEGLSVDVINPIFTLYVEIREWAYLYTEIIPANGGMPLGSNGKAMLLLSGGIDSPVAGWMIGKRGVGIEAVHFYSYPYTSERAKEKVIELAKILNEYCTGMKLHIVPFTDIQLEINEKCRKDDLTIIMRRVMMQITEMIASTRGAHALITGESIGQVASQTMQSLAVTNEAVNMPVFRPLIGMDKNEVINIARKINTFETSTLPYEDCCTVFVAKHPNIKPKLEMILREETKLDLENMINEAIKNTELIEFN